MWRVEAVELETYVANVGNGGIEGYRRANEKIADPSWGQVKALFERLDGDQCADMHLDGPNRYGMGVSGGPDRFIVSTIGDDMGPYDLLGPDPSNETSKIVIGGVDSDMPRKHIVTRQQALQAAEYFYYHGQPDPSLKWLG